MPNYRTADEIETYRWLISPAGRDLLTRIGELAASGTPTLRISELLRADEPGERVALALTQRELRHHARQKFPDADRLFFTREGLEQATSAAIADHRARRYGDAHAVVDLCCGIGGDLMALARRPQSGPLTGVDLDPVHLLLARENVAITAPDQELATIEADVRDVDLTPYDAVFIDPARRSASGRLDGIASEPPLEWAISLADRVAAVGIKTAPGIPRDLVPARWELETIALGTDLKEAVLWSPALAAASRTGTVIDDAGVHHLRPVPGPPVPLTAPGPGGWLLDPNPAVTRAGLVEDLARHLGAAKIDEEIAFLVADHPVETPFARFLPIIDALPWHERQLKRQLRDLDAGPVDLRRRGLAGDVDRITRRLRGKGSRRIVVAMTRVAGDPWAIICDIAR